MSIETVEQTDKCFVFVVPKTVCAISHTTIDSTETEDLDRYFVSNDRSPYPASNLSGFESLHCDDGNYLMCKYLYLLIFITRLDKMLNN